MAKQNAAKKASQSPSKVASIQERREAAVRVQEALSKQPAQPGSDAGGDEPESSPDDLVIDEATSPAGWRAPDVGDDTVEAQEVAQKAADEAELEDAKARFSKPAVTAPPPRSAALPKPTEQPGEGKTFTAPTAAEDKLTTLARARAAREQMTAQQLFMVSLRKLTAKVKTAKDRAEKNVGALKVKDVDPWNAGAISLKAAFTNLNLALSSLADVPDDWKRAAGAVAGPKGIEIGAIVNVRPSHLADLGILGEDMNGLKVVGANKGKVVCTTAEGTRILLPRGAVELVESSGAADEASLDDDDDDSDD